jgi:hypothetical protein
MWPRTARFASRDPPFDQRGREWATLAQLLTDSPVLPDLTLICHLNAAQEPASSPPSVIEEFLHHAGLT